MRKKKKGAGKWGLPTNKKQKAEITPLQRSKTSSLTMIEITPRHIHRPAEHLAVARFLHVEEPEGVRVVTGEDGQPM